MILEEQKANSVLGLPPHILSRKSKTFVVNLRHMMLTIQRVPLSKARSTVLKVCAHPSGSRQFLWLGVGSGKVALGVELQKGEYDEQ